MVHMANQIALFFVSVPHEEAVAGVTSHLKNFWERRMLRQLHEHVAAGGAGLHPLVLEAEKRLSEAAKATPALRS